MVTLHFCPVFFLLPGAFRSSSTAGMAEFGISPGQHVAVFWDKSSPEEALKKLVDRLQGLTGSEGQVFMENITQLLQCEYPPSFARRARSVFMGVLLACGS